jgi:hypothetical protein
MMTNTKLKSENFYGSGDVQRLTGLAWLDLVRLESTGQFPKRVPDEDRATWDRVAVDAWILENRRR